LPIINCQLIYALCRNNLQSEIENRQCLRCRG